MPGITAVESLDDFKAKLSEAGDKLIVVDFFATWCGPCKMIAPKMAAMADTYADVMFLKVDVDEAEDIAAEYGISAMPTFKFFKGGNPLGEDVVGANEAKIEEVVKKNK